MSWFTEYVQGPLGIGPDSPATKNQVAQTAAIQQQQQFYQGMYGDAKNNYNTSMTNMNNANSAYTQQASNTSSWLNNQASTLLNNSQSELTNEFGGALKDIYTQGRNQAAGSGLIGGFQEGQNVSPQIAALGKSYATTLQQNQNQNNQALMGVYNNSAQMQLSPYAQQSQQAYGMANTNLSSMYGIGGQLGQSYGNYADNGPSLLGGAAGFVSSFIGKK